MAAITTGNPVLVKDWDSHPLREYPRSEPSPELPVQSLLENSQEVSIPGAQTVNVYPGFTSQLTTGELVVVGATVGNDVIQIDATNTVSTYISWADLVAAVAALSGASQILSARVDTMNRLVLVWQDSLDSTCHVARFNADKTLDLTEGTGDDGSGPGYVAISPDGNKLAYVMDALVYTQFGRGGNQRHETTFREWSIGGSEETLATYMGKIIDDTYATWNPGSAPPDPPYPYPADVALDLDSGIAIGYAENGDPVLIFSDRTSPPAILLVGQTTGVYGFPSEELYPGESHTWAFSHGSYANTYSERDVNWPLPASSVWTDFSDPGTVWSSISVPKDGTYDIFVEFSTHPEGTDISQISTVSLRVNGGVVASITQPDYNAYDHSTFTYTGSLTAGDTITVTVETDSANTLYVSDISQRLVAALQEGWQYTLYAQRFGASPSLLPLSTYTGAPQMIFVGDPFYNLFGSPPATAPSTTPYLAADGFEGHTTAWLWLYDNETLDQYLAKVNLTVGQMELFSFSDEPGNATGVSVPIWIAMQSLVALAAGRRPFAWFMG